MDFLFGLMTGILLIELAILAWFPMPQKNGTPLKDFPRIREMNIELGQHVIRVIQYPNGNGASYLAVIEYTLAAVMAEI